MEQKSKSIHVLPGVVALFGGLLFLLGLRCTLQFFDSSLQSTTGVPGWQMLNMALMFVGLVCGGLAFYHGRAAMLGRPSRPLQLPAFYLFWIVFALVLGLGNLFENFPIAPGLLFPPLFLLGAALPTFAVLAWAARRLGSPISWRQAALAFVFGSTISILLAIVLETILPLLVYLFFPPLGFLGWIASEAVGANIDPLQRLFLSPLVLVLLLFTALEAPIPEEFSKALSARFFGKRITTEAQALMIGLAAGAGFAIMENMMYEGVYAWNHDWSWGGVTLLRGFGSVLHPACTAIVVMGWFRAREHGPRELWKAYGAAVGLHTLWNGGFDALIFLSGIDLYHDQAISLSLYGEQIQLLLIVYLVLLAGALWLILHRQLGRLEAKVGVPAWRPVVIHPRALAGWAVLCALAIVPLGAALGPAARAIQAALWP